ncbi:MAG: GDSL-type esterase/lipase family protein [Candidatus Izemoplasma sp.]|nr:GDSL-type esterase/lipase family protein [Candidatus Izemoplasma sp.]
MKIIFLGDSLTEGTPGVSFFAPLKESFSNHKLINYGKGGDTVSSLLARLKRLDLKANIIVLFVGANDVFVKVSWTFSVYKTITKQKWAKDKTTFKDKYDALLSKVTEKATHVIVIPPLLIGEQLDNEYNQLLKEYRESIEHLVNTYQNIDYIDLHQEFKNYLDAKESSDYIAKSLKSIMQDVRNLKTKEEIDCVSQDRGLHVTLDGVHLNSTGALIITRKLEEVLTYYINKET